MVSVFYENANFLRYNKKNKGTMIVIKLVILKQQKENNFKISEVYSMSL